MARRRMVKRNPINTAGLAQIAGLALLGFVGYSMAQQGGLPKPLQDAAHSIDPKLPAAPPSNGGTSPSGSGNSGKQYSTEACVGTINGSTELSLTVAPWNPAKEVGASVVYSGRLLGRGLAGVYVPMGNETIEFWDAAACQPFLAITTDGDGFYHAERPLQGDELSGYAVFAFYRGNSRIIANQDPAVTGVWQVRPGA